MGDGPAADAAAGPGVCRRTTGGRADGWAVNRDLLINFLSWAGSVAVLCVLGWTVRLVLRLPRPWGWVVLGLAVVLIVAWVVGPTVRRRRR